MDLLNIVESRPKYDMMKKIFFVAMNGTFRTGIAINTDPIAINALEGMLCITNAATESSKPNTALIPTYIKLQTKVIAASGTDFSIRFATDTADRYASGGSTLTGNQTYVGSEVTRRTSKATIKFGDLTLGAATAEKAAGQVTFHAATVSQTVGNTYLITFGNYQLPSALVSAAAIQTFHQAISPVFIERGGCLIAQPFETASATTAANFEVEIGYYEVRRDD